MQAVRQANREQRRLYSALRIIRNDDAGRQTGSSVGCTLHVHIHRRLYSVLRIIRNDDAGRQTGSSVGSTLHVHIHRSLYSVLRIIRNDDADCRQANNREQRRL